MNSLPKLALNSAPRPAAYAFAVLALSVGGWFGWQGWQAYNAYVPLGVRVISSQVDTLMIVGKPKYGAAITYEFIFDGITQTSSGVLKGNPEMSASEAASWVERYPVGLETTAYFNGTDANDVVLQRENRFRLPGAIAVLGLVALLFLLWEDRERWLPKLRGTSSRGPDFVDPRGRPPEMQMVPPPGMENAIWDPSPGPDGLPRGWVNPEDQ